MRSRLIGTVAVTAALSSLLSFGTMQIVATSPAAATSVAAAPSPPSETDLLQQIVDNTKQTNSDLTKINTNLAAMLKDEGKTSINTDNTALRLKVVNTNLVALHNQLKSIFAYRGPKTKYTFNALSDLMAGLCAIIGTLSSSDATNKPVVLPPC